MDKETQKLLLNKLRQPIHHNYITKYILKTTPELGKEILNKLVNDGMLKEVNDGYYVVN
jgi:hypothetical protein